MVTDESQAALIRWLLHDLATPVATILTASEMLGPDEDQELRDMVCDGAKRLAARLRLIRTVLAPGDAAVAGAALAGLVAQGIGAKAVWTGGAEPVDSARAAILAGLALALPGVRYDLTECGVTVHGRAPAEAVVAALTGAGDATDRHAVLAGIVAAGAAARGLELQVTDGDGATVVEIVNR